MTPIFASDRSTPAYNGQLDVIHQLVSLRKYLGHGLRCSSRVSTRNLPQGKTLLVSVRSEHIASTYEQAVQDMLLCLSVSRDENFVNHLKGRMGSEQLRECDTMKNRLHSLEDLHEDSDVLIFPALPGSKCRNKTTLRARGLLSVRQFPLSVLDVASYLLTHPELLTSEDDTGWVCARDSYFEEVDGRVIERVPYFTFDEGELHFDALPVDHKDDAYGFPIGCIP